RQMLQARLDLSKRHAEIVATILTKKQLRRAEQIYLQRIGPPLAFRRPQVAAALKLTDEQKEKMDLVRKEYSQELRELAQARGRGDDWRQKGTELYKDHMEKLLNVLTPAQKTKWKQLLGEPFKFEPRRPQEKK